MKFADFTGERIVTGEVHRANSDFNTKELKIWPHDNTNLVPPTGFVLAHAYYPYDFGSSGGDVHFDEDEAWDPSDTAAAR